MQKRLAASCVFALTAVLALGALAAESAAPKAAAVGEPAPGFTLTNENGKPVSLSDFKGKIVVLEWTNKDCPFVQRHLKAKTMVNLAAKYKPSDVVWLAIDSTKSHTIRVNLKTATDNALGYPILDDSQGTVGKEYGAKSTPDMFIINKDGTLAYSGAIDNDEDGDKKDATNYVAQALDEILANKPVATPETKSYGCSVKYAK